MFGLRIAGVLAMVWLIALAANAQVATADGELAIGTSLREKGDYAGAIEHLERAVALDPKLVEAHFMLASVADEMCQPSAEPGPDEHACNLAMQEYENVLRLDASHLKALTNFAYLLFEFARLDESENRYRAALALQPDNAETLCAVGAIDFLRSYRDLMKRKAELKLRANEPLIHSPECNQIRIRNEARIEEGIALLQKSYRVEVRNSDILGYLTALYAARADTQCNNPQAYRADRNTANEWNRQRKKLRESRLHFFQKCPPAPPPPPDN